MGQRRVRVPRQRRPMVEMSYQPGRSLLHRLHPLTKVAWLVVLTVTVFLTDAPVSPLVVAAGALILLTTCGIPPWRAPGMRVWLPLAVAILVTHALAVQTGTPLAGPLTNEGVASGLRAMGRLVSVVTMSTLFVLTTDPVSLTCALMRGGLPYRWGFALVTSLRLAPVFRMEAHHIYRAQLVRGVAYQAAGPRRGWLVLRHLCLPLLVSALRTAHALSLSMEGRGFGRHRRRTFTREVAATRADVIAALLLPAAVAATLWQPIARLMTGA